MSELNDDISKVASFTVREDPARSAKSGDRQRFEQVTPRLGVLPRFANVENWQMFEGMDRIGVGNATDPYILCRDDHDARASSRAAGPRH
jgi:hypothetical protein